MKASSTINAKQPWCVILAGPNGSGKTTFYDQILKNDPMFQKATFINSDLIGKDLARISGKTDSNEFIIHAGRIALNLINHKIYKQDSFIYETTSSGKNVLRLIKDAKDAGFKVITIFINLPKTLARARVIPRVEHGGHDVPPEVQERRYEKIIQTFPELLKISDISAVFDNSGTSSPKSSKPAHNLIFLMHEDNYFVFNDYPAWLKFSLKNRKTRKLLVPVYERINGRKAKKAEEKVWLNKEKFQQLDPERSTTLIRTLLDNFKTRGER